MFSLCRPFSFTSRRRSTCECLGRRFQPEVELLDDGTPGLIILSGSTTAVA